MDFSIIWFCGTKKTKIKTFLPNKVPVTFFITGLLIYNRIPYIVSSSDGEIVLHIVPPLGRREVPILQFGHAGKTLR